MEDFDFDILQELVVESREKLEEIEPDLLIIEKDIALVNEDIVNRIFRAVHSVKGGFGFFGITPIVELSHSMENVMSRVRARETAVTPDMVDAFLAGVDKLKFLLDNINDLSGAEISSELDSLAPFLDCSGRNHSSGESCDPDNRKSNEIVQKIEYECPDTINLDHIRKTGKYLYLAELSVTADNAYDTVASAVQKWSRYGDILNIDPDMETLRSAPVSAVVNVIIATVLANDLIVSALELSPSGIKMIEPVQKCSLSAKSGPQSTSFSASRTSSFASEDVLRVKVELLNALMNNAGELVLGRNQLMQNLNRNFSTLPDAERIKSIISAKARSVLSNVLLLAKDSAFSHDDLIRTSIREINDAVDSALDFSFFDVEGLSSIVQNIDMVTSVVQGNIMQTRMQPISVIFGKFPRLVRDLSKKLNKKAELTLIGQEVELDKSILEQLSDPLVHLVRNCLDHGLEFPDKRAAAGKDPVGNIILKASHEGGRMNIEIIDDGSGIKIDNVRKRVVDKGLAAPEEFDALSKEEKFLFIFTPGFSTAEQVSDISGRGVGMDVVKTNIEKLSGSIEIESNEGEGTRILLKLPLTLAIIPSLLIQSEGRTFAIPQSSLDEIVRIRAIDVSSAIKSVNGADVLCLREELLPLVWLAEILDIERTYEAKDGTRNRDRRNALRDRRKNQETIELTVSDEHERRREDSERRISSKSALKIIILKTESNRYGLVVDEIFDSEEIVVKPLSAYLKSCGIYSGATIMGDGRVVMILDSNGIAETSQLRFASIQDAVCKAKAEEADSVRDIMLFNNGTSEEFAVYLSDVSRVEKCSIEQVEVIGSHRYLKYADRTLPLMFLHEQMNITIPEDAQRRIFFVLVVNAEKFSYGIIVPEVEDVVSVPLILDDVNVKGHGVRAGLIFDDSLRILIDTASLAERLKSELGHQGVR